MPAPYPALTVVLPTKNEAANLPALFQQLHAALDGYVAALEILVADTPTGDGTEALCKDYGAHYVKVPGGFADALRAGFTHATHPWLVTMDADGSHDPLYIRWLLQHAGNADLVLASRYVPQGGQETTLFRYATSRVLNWYLGLVCSMPVQDLSGGFKLYRKAMFKEFDLVSRAFEIQAEITIKAYGHGFKVREVPFCYVPRLAGRSKAAILKYGMAFLVSSLRLRRFRNSILFCDYYERAFRSRIPLQRYWQRQRYAVTMDLAPPRGECLDVGCGTGRMIMAHPRIVGLDLNPRVVRYLGHYERRIVQASAAALPCRDGTFDTIYCSEIVEHLPADSALPRETARCLRPGGRVLVACPDYGGFLWPLLYRLYRQVVAPDLTYLHASQPTTASVTKTFTAQGLRLTASRRMLGCLLFLRFEKPATT